MPAHVISSEQQRDRMLYTPIPKLIVSLSVPTLASQLISVFYNTADTYFVSKLSTSASAAVGVVFSLMSIIQAFGFGIGMGCGSIISRSLGNRDNERANRTASSAFFFAAAVGLLICIAGLCTLRPLMRLLGSTETILPYSESYARIILLAAPIMCASFVLSNTLRSEGEAMLSMYGICTGGLLNVALDPLFIFVFDMGIAGAALATALSQLVSFCILAWLFLHGRSIVPGSPPLRQQTARTLRRNSACRLPDDLQAGLRQSVLGAFKQRSSRLFRRGGRRRDDLQQGLSACPFNRDRHRAGLPAGRRV